jgi:hypothetical protein
MSTQIRKKGDIIINPRTQRPVKVGSRVWLNLVKQGIVEGRYTDPKELGDLPEQYEEIPPQEIEEKIEQVNKTLPKHQQAVRGRGRYKGKIVSRNKRLAPEEVSRYTAQVATRAVANNINTLAEYEDDDIEGIMLEKMILAEMMGGNSKPQAKPKGRTKQKVAPTQEVYEEVEPEEYDYEEVEEDDYPEENWEY